MSIQSGQLRVWDDAITLDKIPFLVVERVIYPDARVSFTVAGDDWRVLQRGKIMIWSTHRMKTFSKVIDESR